ncbi:carbonic anhydrase [Desulfotomaculum nigrificans CO-1-SRB]|uniref:Carbonic anhydrase n=1 Tax=Desulfotomaculum nigrificans (strain DSM 14880 / VKM B-2319 / CO-1-SRB) TaxID=868595 RepID=F6B4C5_DESCC|nr:carbonic anhydrase [Desulfotomaculum nigrificans]AEF95302.1 carbonic anhydrase [Desulfotomaculum nigrificans CO-1-SRB]
MPQIVPVNTREDIFSQYLDTPIGDLIEYHNFGKPFEKKYVHADILIGMCMDNRKHLNIPEKFAYIIRTGGGNMRLSEFKVSYAVAVGGVRAIALIGHNNCGMVNLMSKEQKFVDGLVEVGWDRKAAEDHFRHFAPMFEIGNEIDFLLAETNRIRQRYPKVLVAPLFYQVEDNRLYLVQEDK